MGAKWDRSFKGGVIVQNVTGPRIKEYSLSITKNLISSRYNLKIEDHFTIVIGVYFEFDK